MKNRLITSLIYLITALLLIVGPNTIFKVCEVMEKPMKCYYSTKAVVGIAIILIAIAILYFFTRTIRESLLLTIAVIPIGIITLLIPSILIGGCSMKTMACQAVSFPAIYVISVLLIIISVFNIFYLIKSHKRNLVKLNEAEQKNYY
ncbi:DUF4418 family protein [Ruminiclostridium herbifermentans]|uniref:DUF4418 family protein n=1 Tax=Ruminiclostridium herbifermentans TaxID=2488810 RepID=A0A4U7JN81_9FIRM|nr:DUF4418 family protein [Ruminiclostridium herbifermentans]QNU68591.1 DUF4418 family protein [Ruminiclostridium herbifermentans]